MAVGRKGLAAGGRARGGEAAGNAGMPGLCTAPVLFAAAVAVVLAFALVAGCAPSGASTSQGRITVEEAEASTGISAEEEGRAYAAGVVLATFAEGTSTADVESLLRQAESVEDAAVSEGSLVVGRVEGGVLHGTAAGGPVAELRVSQGSTVVQAVAELQQSPLVVEAQPDYLYSLE